MNLDLTLRYEIQKAVTGLFNQSVDPLQLQPTNQEFEGSHTLVCFPLTRISRKSPEDTARLLGEYLVAQSGIISRFNVVKGFLNLSISDETWTKVLASIHTDKNFGVTPPTGREIMVEYSSPNTNKPLHLGHLRNNFLGYSVAEIYRALGYKVHKVQIINDRGIHICKSMAAWQLFAKGETPQSSSMKGDHFVGKYYVKFDQELRIQTAKLTDTVRHSHFFEPFEQKESAELLMQLNRKEGLLSELSLAQNNLDFSAISLFGSSAEILAESALDGNIKWKQVFKSIVNENAEAGSSAKKETELSSILNSVISIENKLDEVSSILDQIIQPKTSIMKLAVELLQKWEAKDPETWQLWKSMNGWVYEGFDLTYKRMGVDFEKLYFESQTYSLGKDEVMRGAQQGVFFKKDDGSIWVDLTAEGLDQKVLLRSDGTSVYMTQDIGTAILRFRDFPKIEGQVYTVGNEQEYHFKVLFLILAKLGYEWAKKCYHLSYGMVDLPSGKMKSREGTVVDADDLMDEMVKEAAKQTQELGKIEEMTEMEVRQLSETIGMGALKYYLVKVDPKKRMLFNPEESISLQGHTGPFIQYTYARIQAIIRKAHERGIKAGVAVNNMKALELTEREVIGRLSQYPARVVDAAREYSPAVIANYAYDLAKDYNQFYQTIPIFSESDQARLLLRIALSSTTGDVLKKAMGLLGIHVPERM